MIQPDVNGKEPLDTSVVIVGGGVAGLFFANACEQNGLSYVLLEAGKEIAPALGASIGLLPHGLCLLDQINVLSEVEKYQVRHRAWEHRNGDTGELLNRLTAMSHYTEETGYGVFFLERQQVLQILYDNLKDKSVVFVDRRVVKIDSLDEHAVVHTRDGHKFKCQLVVGADGVHSIVRDGIQKVSEPGINGQEFLDTRFSCIYGISEPLEQMGPGMAFSSYRKGSSCLVFTGLKGIVYWFVFKELSHPVSYDSERHLRFSATDSDALIKEVLDCKITDGVTFSDILDRSRTAIITPLEDGVVRKWFSKRMVLIGDAAHKMVPHAAMGGNLAMESAGCLVNMLLYIRDIYGDEKLEQIPLSVVEEGLQKYADNRQRRAEAVVMVARSACRDQLCLNKDYDQRIAGLTNAEWLGRSLASFSGTERIRTVPQDKSRVQFYTKRAKQIQELLQTGHPARSVVTAIAPSA